MIHVHAAPNPFDMTRREDWSGDWDAAMNLDSIAPDWFDAETSAIFVNGGRVGVDAAIADGDHVYFLRRPCEPISAANLFLYLFLLVASTIITRKLLPDIVETDEPDSPNDQFGAFAVNARGDGFPLPVWYGVFRHGGIVIAEFLSLNPDPSIASTFDNLKAMYALAGHEMNKIGEATADGGNPGASAVHIDGQPLGNFTSGKVEVRLGTENQTKIDGFEDLVETINVDALVSGFAPTGIPSTPGVVAVGSEDLWIPTIFAKTNKASDHFGGRVFFDFGLFDIDGDGDVFSITFKWQLRYVRIDDGDNPIGSWIVLPVQQVKAQISGPFFSSFLHDFFSPTGLVLPAQGGYADLDGSNDYLTRTGLSGLNTEVTVITRIWLKKNEDGNWLCSDDTGTGGRLRFRVKKGSVAGQVALEVTFTYIADPDDVFEVDVGTASAEVGRWVVVAMTRTNDVDGLGTKQVSLYWDGGGVGIFTPTNSVSLWTLSANVVKVGARIGTEPAGLSNYASMRVDEWKIYDRRLGPQEIAEAAFKKDAFGNLISIFGTSDEAGIRAGAHFDVDGGGTSPDYVVGDNWTLQNGASIVAAGGALFSPISGTISRQRHRVEFGPLVSPIVTAQGKAVAHWSDVQFIRDGDFQHPGVSKLAIEFQASPELTRSPGVSVLGEGKPIEIWDGLNPEAPSFTKAFSRNNAWIARDAILNRVFGAASQYEPILQDFKDWADYCDELVRDGNSSKKNSSTLSYAAGPKEVTIKTTGSAPSHWIVGYNIAIEGTGTDWDTPSLKGLVIVSRTESGSEDVFVCDWPTGVADPADPAPLANAATIQGRHVRCRFDWVFDRVGEAWTEILRIFQAGNASPILIGNKIGVSIERAKARVGVIGMANMVPGTFKLRYINRTALPNSVDIFFRDEEQDYERRSVPYDDEDLQATPTSFDFFVKDRIELVGVTRRVQCLRFGKRRIKRYKKTKKEIQFAAGVDAVHWLPGDRVGVAHDVPSWGLDGRVWVDSSVATSIKLDREIVIAPATTYVILLRHSATDGLETVTVDQAAGTYPPNTAISIASPGFALLAAKDDWYSFGLSATVVEDMVCLEIEPNIDNMTRLVTMLTYDVAVFDDEADIEPGSIAASSPPPGNGLPDPPVSFTVSEENWRASDGTIRFALVASWWWGGRGTPADRVALLVSSDEDDGNPRVVAEVPGHAQRARLDGAPIKPGRTYYVWIQPIGFDGRHSRVRECVRRRIEFSGMTQRPPKPTSVTAELRGERAIWRWNVSDAADQLVEYVEARIGGWVLGQRLFFVPANFPEVDVPWWGDAPPNAANEGPPRIQVRRRLANAQVGDPLRIAPALASAGEILLSASGEEADAGGWDGLSFSPVPVITNLQETADTPPKLEFSGTNLTGSYETTTYDLGDKETIYVQAWVVAKQRYSVTLRNLPFPSLRHNLAKRWSLEGPLTLFPDESQSVLKLLWRYSETTTLPTTYKAFRPGEVFARKMQFKIEVTRPDATTYDLEIRRLAIRLTEREPTVTPRVKGRNIV